MPAGSTVRLASSARRPAARPASRPQPDSGKTDVSEPAPALDPRAVPQRARRRQHFGSVRKLTSGRWQASYWVKGDATSQRSPSEPRATPSPG